MANHTEAYAAIKQIRELITKVSVKDWIDQAPETVNTRFGIIERAAKAFKRSSYKIKKLALEQTDRFEYCKPGSVAIRGYYCPDPMQDIIITNCKRPNIAKRRLTVPPYLIYHFNSDNELIMIEEKGVIGGIYDKTELLIRFDNFRIGFSFPDIINDPERYIDVRLECKTKKKYILSYYTVVRKKDGYHISEQNESILITFLDGLPRKWIRMTEWIDVPSILKELYHLEDGDHICANEYELFYDESGYPLEYVSKGDICPAAHVKLPVMDGMF